MRKNFYIIIALLFVCTFSASAQWTATSGPLGGNINNLQRSSSGSSSGNLYAVVNNQLYQSTNSGTNWSLTPVVSPSSFYLSDLMINTDGTMYAVYFSTLYSSTDNGANWTVVASNLFQGATNITKVGPDGVFVVWGYNGVYISVNKGVAWTQISSLNPYGSPALVANSSGDIFYSTYNSSTGFYKVYKHPYQALTSNWSSSNMVVTTYASTQYDAIQSMAVDKNNNLYVLSSLNLYKSTDAATSFSSIKASLPLSNFYGVLGNDASVSGTNVFFFSNGDSKIYKASNPIASTVWTSTASPTVNYGSNMRNYVFVSASNYFIGTDGDGVFMTSDTGSTWAFKSAGFTTGNFNEIAVANTTNNLIVVKGGKGYWFSSDGGATWTAKSLTGNVSHVMKLASDGTIIMYGSQVFRSTDNGATFTSNGTFYGDAKIVEASNGDLYGFRYGKISKSTDKGATWSDLTITGLPSPANFYFQGAAIDGTTNFIFQLYDQNVSQYKLFKMVGTTATLLTSPYAYNFNNIFFQNSNFYVSQYSAFYYTTDLGATWTTVGFSGNAIFPIKNSTYSGIAVGRGGSLYISQDNGGSWNNTTLPTNYPNAYINSIGADASGNYYASAQGATVLKFVGSLLVNPTTLPPFINFNWQALNGPYGGRVNKIAVHPDGVSLFCITSPAGSTLQKRLWKYNGTSWSKIEPVVTNGAVLDVTIDASGAVYVLPQPQTSPQKIYKSTNGGTSWSPLTSTGLPAGTNLIQRIEILSDGSILAFGAATTGGKGVIYKSTDNGATFTLKYTSAINVTYGQDAVNNSRKPAISPTTPGTIVIFGNIAEGLLVSTDFGSTWNVKSTASIADPTNGFVGSYMYDKNGNLILQSIFDSTIPLWDARISKSTDNGSNWTTLPSPTISNSGATANYSKRIVTLASGEYLMCVQSIFDCYRSVDGGATWNNVGNVGDVFEWAAWRGSDSFIVGSGDAGILKTSDGITFTPFSQGMPHPAALAINLSNSKDIVVGATRPYYTSDFGQNFSLSTLEPAANYLQVKDSLIGYGSRLLLKSKDGGKTWKDFGTDRSLAFLTADATGSGFYGSDGTNLSYSTDLINWTNIVLSGLPAFYGIDNMVIDQGGIIYAIVEEYSDANFSNFVSIDVYKIVFGSATKISKAIGTTNPATIIYVNGKIYLYDTQGTIYKSTDGNVWTQGTAPSGNSMCASNGYLFIAGDNSVLWLSRNDGSTWQSVGDVPPASGTTTDFRNVVVNPYDGYAYATLSNSVAKRSGNMVMPNDNTAPVATAYLPTVNATGVGLKPTLTITFDEITNAVAGKLVRVFDSANPALPIETLDMSTATRNVKAWSIPTTSVLSFNKTYFVVIDAGAVTDIFGNPFAGISSSSTWKFTTKVAPTVSSLSPSSAAVNVPLNSQFSITFSEAVSGITGKNLSLYKSSAPTTVVTTLDGATGTLNGNQLTFTFSNGTLQYGTAYFIKFDASEFKTADGGAFSALTLNTDWTFTTVAAPTVSSLSPTNGAINVPLNSPFTITFSEPVTGAVGKNLSLYKSSAPTTVVTTLDGAIGTSSGNQLTFNFPSGTLQYATSYFIKFDLNEFQTALGVFSVLTQNTDWTFTTLAAPDIQAPTITFTSGPISKGAGNKTFSPSITDDIDPTPTAKIFYKSITKSVGFDSTNLTRNATTAGKYDVTIPETSFGPMGLEFYFIGKDATGNKVRSPQTGNYYSYITYPAASSPQIPGGLIGVGGTVANWRIVTVPFSLSDNKISTVFGELGTSDITKWRMITYKNATAWAEYPNDFTTFTQGTGYFINIKDSPVNGLVIDGATTPSNNKATPFTFTLAPGWNEIGNPYTFPIVWSEVLAANPTTSAGIAPVLKTYNGDYADLTNGTLSVFEGAFVMNTNSAPVTLSVPLDGSKAGGRLASTSATNNNLSNDQWMVPIKLQVGDRENTFGGVGMNPQAQVGIDGYDDFNLPHFLDFAEINFAHPEHFLKKTTRDVVPTQSEYSWDFTVTTSLKGPAQLTWDNSFFGNNSKELYLYDIRNGLLVNMREQNSFNFDPANSSLFKIYFGEDLKSKIKPEGIGLGQAYPNPSQGNVNIPFTLPENQSGYEVVLEIYNSMGQKISSLVNGHFNPGFYNYLWETGQSDISSGMYIYRLRVSDVNRSETLNEKIIINR